LTSTRSASLESDPLYETPSPYDPWRPRPGGLRVGEAIRRGWPLIVACMALLAAAGGVFAIQRTPTYTAQVRMNAGASDVRAEALPGFVDAAISLAASYAETVGSQGVVSRIAATTGLPRDTVKARVTATDIPESPIFKIDAQGPSAGDAIKLANASAAGMLDYLNDSKRQGDDSATLLTRYRAASQRAGDINAQINRLKENLISLTSSARDARQKRINQLTVEADTANLQAQTLGQLYQTARQNTEGSAQLRLLDPATSAASDRMSVLQQMVFVGLVAGALLGMGLVVLLAASRARRRA
jgi:uncharacterized protein involved in exopolysaccharide biosynthesis